eukprot:9040829-Alexandrium_andersonii.AAC.1
MCASRPPPQGIPCMKRQLGAKARTRQQGRTEKRRPIPGGETAAPSSASRNGLGDQPAHAHSHTHTHTHRTASWLGGPSSNGTE